MGPDHAIVAAQDLRAKVVMPIHWGLFNLAFHDWFQPPERLTELAAAAGLPLWIPEPGEPAEFNGTPRNTLWWRRYMSSASRDSHEHATEAAAKVVMRA